ncbi:OmpH family outer membrane protein [Vampirovibrio sp.]|uniref:OmpH family outer membrane protein n=1 Tax=Vampirovibrio sp. TaxID=2717857 RepID=UPI003593441A
MKRILTIVLSVLVLGLGGLRAAQAADTIGTIDYEKLVRSYNKAQMFNDDMKAKEADLEKMQAEFVKQIREAKTKQPNNPVAVDQLQKSLEDKLAAKVNEYRDTQASKAKSLEDAMTNTIQDVARGKNLSVIIAKQSVFVGGTDITNDVLSRLNAAGTTPAAK